MRELRFAKDLYIGEQVDAAVKVFERFGTLERDEEEAAWIVRVDAQIESRTRANSRGNSPTTPSGLTIQQSRVSNEGEAS